MQGHERVALELSGGKDSVACLYLLRHQLHKITVYWLNTGDAYPETLDVIDECRKICHSFVEVRSDVQAWKRLNGIPSDVVPITGEHVHLAPKHGEIRCVDSYTCCAHNIMNPLHEKVIADGNTLIIRGQKVADEHKSPIRSGDWHDGVQVLFPIENWTDEEVMDYLRTEGAPIHPTYEHSPHGADCRHCTGWWSHTNIELLKRYPMSMGYVMSHRRIIREMVNSRMKLC